MTQLSDFEAASSTYRSFTKGIAMACGAIIVIVAGVIALIAH